MLYKRWYFQSKNLERLCHRLALGWAMTPLCVVPSTARPCGDDVDGLLRLRQGTKMAVRTPLPGLQETLQNALSRM